MAVLDNYNRHTYGTSRFNNNGYQGSQRVIASIESLYRNGVTRPKPADLNPTPYERRQLNERVPVGTWVYKDPWGTYTTEGLHDNWGLFTQQPCRQYPPGNGIPSNPLDVAYVKALSQLNRRDIDLGTAFAESGKTAQMVGDIATRSIRALNSVRRRDVQGLLSALGLNQPRMRGKGVVDAYLTYHYGIKPLLYDVSGAVNALVRLPADDWTVQVEGKYADVSERHHKVGGLVPFRTHSTARNSAIVRIRAHQKTLSRADDVRWATGLDNPLGTAWELTPWSFVIDWVTPIGDWLSGVNALRYYDRWQIVSSQFLKEEIAIRGHSAPFNYGHSSSTCSGSYDFLHVRRTVSEAPWIPVVPLKNPASLDHMAKGLALLASVFARGDVPRYLRV